MAAALPFLYFAAAAVGGYAASGGFSSADETVGDVPQQNDPRAEEARRRALLSESARSGRASTFLTSGKGMLDEPIVSKPTLLSSDAPTLGQ